VYGNHRLHDGELRVDSRSWAGDLTSPMTLPRTQSNPRPRRRRRRAVLSLLGTGLLASGLFAPLEDRPRLPRSAPAGAGILASRRAPTEAELAVSERVGCTRCYHASAVLNFVTLNGTKRHEYGPFHTFAGGATSPNGRWFLYGDWSGRVHLVNLATKRQRLSIAASGFAFSYDSRYIAFAVTSYANDSERLNIYRISSGRIVAVDRGARIGYAGEANGNEPGFAWAHESDQLVFTIAPPRPGPWEGPDWLGVVSEGRPASVRRVWIGRGLSVSPPAWSWADRGLLYWRSERSGRVGLILKVGARRAVTVAVGPRGQCDKGCSAMGSPPVATGARTVLAGADVFAPRGLLTASVGREYYPVTVPAVEHYGFSEAEPDRSGIWDVVDWAPPVAHEASPSFIALWGRGHKTARMFGSGLSASWVYQPVRW